MLENNYYLIYAESVSKESSKEDDLDLGVFRTSVIAVATDSLKLIIRGNPSVSSIITKYTIKQRPSTTYLS